MADTKKNADAGTEQVQKRLDEEQEKGYRGETVDPTPRENYTVKGVTSGAPTPETDDKAADAARESVTKNRIRRS